MGLRSTARLQVVSTDCTAGGVSCRNMKGLLELGILAPERGENVHFSFVWILTSAGGAPVLSAGKG
jgi:hypothetical protein